MLLSRAAEAVYWTGRYLERAESTARIIKVHTELYLDLPGGQARSALVAALGRHKVFGAVATSRNWRTVLALAEMSAR